VDVLARCLPRASETDLLARAVTVWSTVHGFASLKNAGVLTNIPGMPRLDVLETAAVANVVRVVEHLGGSTTR
jgi:hypothetical protein